MDAKNGADINILTAAKENNFKGHPILGHGIKGIVIAGEAKSAKTWKFRIRLPSDDQKAVSQR